MGNIDGYKTRYALYYNFNKRFDLISTSGSVFDAASSDVLPSIVVVAYANEPNKA